MSGYKKALCYETEQQRGVKQSSGLPGGLCFLFFCCRGQNDQQVCAFYTYSEKYFQLEAEAEDIPEAVQPDAAQYILPAAGEAMEAAEDVFEKLAQFKSISV